MDFANLIQLLTALLAGVFGVPVIQLFKQWFGLEDNGARVVAIIVSFILGTIGVALNGEFSGFEVTFEAIAEMGTAVFAFAQVVFGFLKGQENPVARFLRIGGG